MPRVLGIAWRPASGHELIAPVDEKPIGGDAKRYFPLAHLR